MLQNGASRYFFEMWCSDERNGLMISGYTVEGTLAKVSCLFDVLLDKDALGEVREVRCSNGRYVEMRMTVRTVSFSAHSDFTQTSEFVDKLRPRHIVRDANIL
jgi:cleavage and polyadenylation specificity factor subunit 3